MRNSFLPFHVPEISEEDIAAVAGALRSGWVTAGPQVKDFEAQFVRYTGAEHAIAVNSGTAALHLALEAAGIKASDEVLVPAMTFAATAEVVVQLGARPVLVDCTPDTLNIDPAAIERAVTPRTRAIIPVHFAGHPCDMDAIMQIAAARRLTVVEDAAHALPARWRGRMVGTIGDLTCFSFYATKTITTGEGGMITTANPDWAERMRIMSLHGISKDAWKRYTAEGSWRYEIIAPGYKYNLTDIAAALGISQLARCEDFLRARLRCKRRYDEGFAGVSAIKTPVSVGDIEHAWHLYVIKLDLEQLRIDRDQVIALLKDRNIGVAVHFIPLHMHPYYRDTYGYTPADFPCASAAFERIISLPIYPRLSDADIEEVVSAVIDITTQYRR
ncbi:MAG TPA: DegT/DnrJ/EryC1/StrS aminotransferase family protein [Candidatus Binataceae bacterium]|nr:DegT/DnrJ/EryC1/StrS aminotransferase family protein [Candidatus Binataceae bacterium]